MVNVVKFKCLVVVVNGLKMVDLVVKMTGQRGGVRERDAGGVSH